MAPRKTITPGEAGKDVLVHQTGSTGERYARSPRTRRSIEQREGMRA